MTKRHQDIPGASVLDAQLEALMARNAGDTDWTGTIQNLMALAKKANEEYDFDRAIKYLCTVEDIWNSRGLSAFTTDLRIDLHREKGRAFTSRGDHEHAIAEYQKILKFCRDSSHLSAKSETFTQIGQLLAKLGDHDRALGYLQRAIGAYRRLDDAPGLCRALRNLGVIYVELGEFEEAENYYDEAIAVAESLDDKLIYADLVNNLGTIMNMKGNWQRALELYRESLAFYSTNNEIRKSAYTKNNLAITLAERGLVDEALHYFEQAYETARSIKDASLKLIVDINLADLYLKKGKTVQGRYHADIARQYLVDAGIVNGNLVETIKISGKIAFAEGDLGSALELLNEALSISSEIGAQYLEAEVLLERGTLYSAMEHHFDALADLEASYRIYTSLKAEGKREEAEKVIGSIEHMYLEIFESMARNVDRKDKYTKGHSDRVASFSLLLARELGMRGNALKTIVAAALLHDIGKIKIDDTVLKKAGRLTSEEFSKIKKHPELGVELLRGIEFPWDIKPLLLHHHEKFDGTGYPLGLKGEDIPLGARIISVADVFDALTSDRVYRKAYPVERALAIMSEDSGSAFDTVILKCFAALIRSGKADFVINSRTSSDEMYSIWSRCSLETDDQDPDLPRESPRATMETG